MPILSKLAIAALCAVGSLTLLPAAALADIENGTYSGTTADGVTIGFVVIADPNNAGKHLINGYNWGFNDTCTGGSTLSGGWGTGFGAGSGISITNGKVTIAGAAPYLYVDMVLKIAAGGTATGSIATADPTLSPLNGTKKPKRVLYCSSKKKSLTATLVTPSEAPAATQWQGSVPLGPFTLKQ